MFFCTFLYVALYSKPQTAKLRHALASALAPSPPLRLRDAAKAQRREAAKGFSTSQRQGLSGLFCSAVLFLPNGGSIRWVCASVHDTWAYCSRQAAHVHLLASCRFTST